MPQITTTFFFSHQQQLATPSSMHSASEFYELAKRKLHENKKIGPRGGHASMSPPPHLDPPVWAIVAMHSENSEKIQIKNFKQHIYCNAQKNR